MPAHGRRADAVRNRQIALDAATALLGEPGTALTVEAIAKRAGLGAATVVRAFGGKDALLDAAVAELLRPVVQRAKDLSGASQPDRALRTFLAELMDFQSAYHGISTELRGLNVPATTALRAELEGVVRAMVARAQRAGVIRTDLEPDVLTDLIGQTAFAIARFDGDLAGAYLTVLMDGLCPSTR
ncbi:TetR/AcrR family transcriptional regulator [Amycolatopsis viridis]|uniref:AcrR family transcriptional regulator n=1 Tax=Amycolatopsis viridis TaxID=185678 RepID=A0ABX0T0P5_9PSEU|nr:TetR/AcrR family transcriptional regulator [Amycolatopsis viridis]NIH82194.1 AcrR family transcriptional regulator [Amycolatopsis viridis]